VDEVTVQWPSGRREKLNSVDARQILTVKEGSGIERGRFSKFQSP
jgi:hypothetical protein